MSNYRTSDIERLAEMFKALSNPQRLKIFIKLASCCVPTNCCDATIEGMRRCVGELGADLGLAASTISHHLREMRQAGLMCVKRRGQKVECWISEDAIRFLADFFFVAQNKEEESGRKGENNE